MNKHNLVNRLIPKTALRLLTIGTCGLIALSTTSTSAQVFLPPPNETPMSSKTKTTTSTTTTNPKVATTPKTASVNIMMIFTPGAKAKPGAGVFKGNKEKATNAYKTLVERISTRLGGKDSLGNPIKVNKMPGTPGLKNQWIGSFISNGSFTTAGYSAYLNKVRTLKDFSRTIQAPEGTYKISVQPAGMPKIVTAVVYNKKNYAVNIVRSITPDKGKTTKFSTQSSTKVEEFKTKVLTTLRGKDSKNQKIDVKQIPVHIAQVNPRPEPRVWKFTSSGEFTATGASNYGKKLAELKKLTWSKKTSKGTEKVTVTVRGS